MLKRVPSGVEDVMIDVSIPQSGFCVLKHIHILCRELGSIVSIPQSGFCVLKRISSLYVGIHRAVSIPQSGFCVLKHQWSRALEILGIVSIPQSGFCVLKQAMPRRKCFMSTSFNPSVGILCAQTPRPGRRRAESGRVSIPQSGFCVLKLHQPSPHTCSGVFQSLSRDSVCSNCSLCL